MDPELIHETIEYLKKAVTEEVDPSTLSVYCWTRLGYKRLVGLVLTLVAQPEISPTEPSSGGSSGDQK